MGISFVFKRTVCIFLVALVIAAMPLYSFGASDKYILGSGFPESYLVLLEELHKEHPDWKFRPADTGLTFSEAVKGMMKNPGTNTIWASYAPSYRSVVKGRYNYLTNRYSGGSYIAASDTAVKYYMDPRNFLDEKGIFIFEDKTYASYQTGALVKKIVSGNKVLKTNASSFVDAGKKYDISPLYLATKSITELGSSSFMMDGHAFRYGGKKYSDCYNAYNIGSGDSSGATGGLIYANGGASKKSNSAGPNSSYGRKWDTPEKAITGGARFLRSSFIDKGQATAYTEHFNVMNGKSSLGTHIYMSLIAGPYQMGATVSAKYKAAGIYSKGIEFTIPVYKDMPEKISKKPSSSRKKDNNNYLKALTVKADRKKTFIKRSKLNYNTKFKIDVPDTQETVTIKASAASKTGAKVTGTGTFAVKPGTNKYKVRCKASSGVKRTYTVTVVR